MLHEDWPWYKLILVFAMLFGLTIGALMNYYWFYLICMQLKRIIERKPMENIDD